jgi:hypothetical protein
MKHSKAESWEWLRRLKTKEFKGRVGVKPKTFEEMVEVVRPGTDKMGKREQSFK